MDSLTCQGYRKNIKFSKKQFFVNDLIKENRKFETWEQITHESNFDKNFYFKWIQLVHAIQTIGKTN